MRLGLDAGLGATAVAHGQSIRLLKSSPAANFCVVARTATQALVEYWNRKGGYPSIIEGTAHCPALAEGESLLHLSPRTWCSRPARRDPTGGRAKKMRTGLTALLPIFEATTGPRAIGRAAGDEGQFDEEIERFQTGAEAVE